MHSFVRNYGLTLAILAAFVCVDLGLASTSRVAIDGWLAPNLVALVFLGATLCCVFVRRPNPVSEILLYVCSWAIFSAAGCIFTYLLAAHAGPLADERLVAMDRAIGFDWSAWVGWVHARPVLGRILHAAYASLPWQILGSVVVLAVRRGGRNEEMLLCAAIALVITALGAAALPAAGPFFRDTVLPSDFAMIAQHLAVLHAGSPARFSLHDLVGIVSFPSFHAALAILFIYLHREVAWTTVPVTGLNLVMLLAVPSEGGHYMVDVMAGIAVAAVSIALARRVLARWRGEWSGPVALAPPVPPALHGAEHT